MDKTTDLVRRVLADSSQYPPEFTSFLQRYVAGNSLIRMSAQQLPSLELPRLVGAANQPAFNAGASNFGSGSRTAYFYKDPFGIVHLTGLITGHAVGVTIYVLPAGYRPEMKEQFVAITDTGVGRVDVDQNGNVIFVSGGTTYVSLAGITFRAF